MAAYRWLDSWAEREQRRVDEEQHAPKRQHHVPRAVRIAVSAASLFFTVIKVIAVSALLVGAVELFVSQRWGRQRFTVAQSIALGFALLLVGATMIATTALLIRHRRDEGRNWLTGLPSVSSTRSER